MDDVADPSARLRDERRRTHCSPERVRDCRPAPDRHRRV